MRVVLQNVKTGEIAIDNIPEPLTRRGTVRVRNRCSLVSAGTEKAVLEFSQSNYLKKAILRPDLFRKVLNRAKNDGIWDTFKIVSELIEQQIALGYSCAGEVEEVGEGITDIKVGDRVACAGLFLATHSEYVVVPRNLVAKVPDGCSYEAASFVTLGAIALQGIRLAQVELGETVVVYGLGLLGMITAQLLIANGARVIGTDLDPEKVDWLSKAGGIGLAAGDGLAGAVLEATNGFGADKALICAATKSNDPIVTAPKLLRQKGLVVVVGDVGMDVPRRDYYDKEIDIKISRSYGPGRYDLSYEFGGLDYPYAYVRWTQNRNMECVLQLLASGRVKFEELVTHRFHIADALGAYDLIQGKGQGKFLGILIDYDLGANDRQIPKNATVVRSGGKGDDRRVGVGLVGAGNFGKAFLLPALSKTGLVDFRAICTAGGVSSASVAKKYRIPMVTSDVGEIFSDSQIDAVVIATRHDTHAKFVVDALNAGKAVFVEKPLAMNIEQLSAVELAWQEQFAKTGKSPILTVGFNRRFSPLSTELRRLVQKRNRPASLVYRVNAGPLPADSWHSDSEMGGGRILGEACHFIDFATFVLGQAPIWVSANEVETTDPATKDTVSISLGYPNGSVANIHYCANGSPALAKELVEVFFGGVAVRLENFRRLKVWGDRPSGRASYFGQVKGFREESLAFVNAASGKSPVPQSFPELVAITRATLAVRDAIASGRRIELR